MRGEPARLAPDCTNHDVCRGDKLAEVTLDSPFDRGQNAEPSRTSLPQGYRQGIITAITVMLGFSLAFFRFWSFEANGEWTRKSLIAAVGLTLALALQIVALVRALRLEDDTASEYRITVRWFVASILILGGALVGAAAVYTG
jgi:hypothetical protein